MRDFDAAALDWYGQDLTEKAGADWGTIMDSVVDLAVWIEVAVEHGATLEEISEALGYPPASVEPFMPGYQG